MAFRLAFATEAKDQLRSLELGKNRKDLVRLMKVRKCLALLQQNPRHPGLQSHEFHSMSREVGRKVFVVYVESKTPSAWRVFWHYGPGKEEITIVAITPHP